MLRKLHAAYAVSASAAARTTGGVAARSVKRPTRRRPARNSAAGYQDVGRKPPPAAASGTSTAIAGTMRSAARDRISPRRSVSTAVPPGGIRAIVWLGLAATAHALFVRKVAGIGLAGYSFS